MWAGRKMYREREREWVEQCDSSIVANLLYTQTMCLKKRANFGKL